MTLKAVFIHSLFRTGSTYTWNKFRKSPKYYCYYEPFHQELINLDCDKPEIWRHDKKSTQRMRHPDLQENYLCEYRQLLVPGKKGVSFFKKAFSFDNFCSSADNPDQKQYIDYLLEKAGERCRIPVFQFNRSALRTAWFKKFYPEGLHIYLLRNPRDQFHSYLDMYELNQLDSFLTMDLILSGVNLDQECFQDLARYVPLFAFHADSFEAEKAIYSRLLPVYSTAEKYTIFYYIWFLAFIESGLHADIIMNIDLLDTNSDYLAQFQQALRKYGINDVDFSDAKIRHYDDPVLPRETLEQIETSMQTLVLGRYPDHQVETFAANLGSINRQFFKLEVDTLTASKNRNLPTPHTDKKLLEKYILIFDRFAADLAVQDQKLKLTAELLRQAQEQAAAGEEQNKQYGQQIMDIQQQLHTHELRLKQYEQELAAKEKQLAEITGLRAVHAQQDELLSRLNRQIQEKDQLLEGKEKHIHQLEQELESKTGDLTLQAEQLQQIELAMQEKSGQLKEKDSLLAEKDAQLRQKERQVNRQVAALQEKERKISQVQQESARKEERLMQVMASNSFRLGRLLLTPFRLIKKGLSTIL